ncbi:MAG: hypothetical protein HY654_07315, partial [Acidobacteria bacterium]|nr:hypothetical protein [Acidobacteriota bacterium]
PLAVAVWVWKGGTTRDHRETLHDLAWIDVGFAAVSAGVLLYLVANGALLDLRLATIDYNLRYANETYESVSSMLLYPLSLPIERARVDMLWFLGGLGALLLASQVQSRPSALVTLAWVLAATLSIAVNGRRDLPNYFVQAAPALALAAAAGLDSALDRSRWIRCTVVALLLAGIWRVGAEQPVWGFRFGGLPGILENVRYDLAYVRGHLDRATYLRRFRGEKHDALEIDELTRYVRRVTSPDDPIFVFGFSGGSVCWKSERVSSSRFFWSRPIIIGFEADRRGYGSTGLLDDLRRRPPALVALQKDQWGSSEFFMETDGLRAWLEASYLPDRETPMFSVWLRRP